MVSVGFVDVHGLAILGSEKLRYHSEFENLPFLHLGHNNVNFIIYFSLFLE